MYSRKLKERLLISPRYQLSIILILAAGVLLCGCITNGASDAARIQSGIPANVTPIPIAVPNATSAAAPPVKNTSMATTVPLPANKSTNVSHDFASSLPPAIIFTHVPAYGSNDSLKGKVSGVDDLHDYKLAIYINSLGWWNVPSGDERLTNISSDGSFDCDITRGGTGLRATEIDAFLVPAGFMPAKVSGRYGLPTDVRDNAKAIMAVTRKKIIVTPVPTPVPTLDTTGPNFIY